MALPTTFDLAAELSRWRHSLSAHEAITPERACELESHLRDEIAALQAKGLSAEEAFWVAACRLGTIPSLSGEFTAADPSGVWRNRIFWMAVGLLAAQVAQTVMMVLGGGLVWLSAMHGWPRLGNGVAWLVPLFSLGAMLIFIRGLTAGRWPRLSRLLEAFCSRQGRFPWKFLLLAALPLVGLFILSLYIFTLGPGHFVRPGPMLLGPALFILWPFVLAFLAAAYAPKHLPPLSSEN